ncbi:MAG: phosphotransferase [Ilumatobacteraceae bacterium]
MAFEAEEQLAGGWQTDVRRVGDIVLRSAKPQSTTVIALLIHLRNAGFDAAPQPIGDGFSEDGREQLTFIAGESPQPKAWSDEASWQVGHLLRRLHDITASFVAPADAVWRPWFARKLPGDAPIIGHGDLGPWNILARGGLPVAFIDWDNAGPIDAHWELAQVGWLNAQLHDDDVAALNEFPSAMERSRQLGMILDGYGLARPDRVGFVDKLIEFAIRSARDEAINYRVGPDTVSPASDGFPVLWGVTWRARAAAWMLDNRRTLDTAIGV